MRVLETIDARGSLTWQPVCVIERKPFYLDLNLLGYFFVVMSCALLLLPRVCRRKSISAVCNHSVSIHLFTCSNLLTVFFYIGSNLLFISQ